jgi:DNA-binding CsgD family transcriptional regulator
MAAATATVLERDAEVAAIGAAIDGAAEGEGALVLVSGPAGIGKSALLRAARDRASERGLLVLAAAGSELDRGFPFGVVHQLLDGVVLGADPARRARLLAGAAQRARAVLEPEVGAAPAGDDPGFAALHGLYWLVANLADERPLALVTDDLHWADRPSLRLLEYLARRLEGLGVVVVASARPNEPGAEAELLADLGAGPAARVLRPPPLSEGAAGTLVAAALGAEPEPAFAAACVAATGGNPLLLRALATQAVEHGLGGRAAEAGRVAELGAEGLVPVVRRRLASLGPEASALARAAVVLGAHQPLDRLAAVAGLAPDVAAAAADALVAAELLEAPTWAFVHPVVREAVAGTLAPAERGRLHAVAARLLAAAGARPDEVATHLLVSEPARDAAVVATLRAAAGAAAAEGAAEAAVAFLRRALAEPPPEADAPALLLELGELEVAAEDFPAATGHLTAALDAGLSGDGAVRARAARAGVRMLAEPEPAVAELERARGDAADPALRLRVEALLLDALVFSSRTTARRRALLDAAGDDAGASPVLVAALAHEAGWTGAPAPEVVELARRAVVEGQLLDAVGPATSTFGFVIHALRLAEQAELAAAYVEQGERVTADGGGAGTSSVLDNLHAYWHLSFGSVATGLARTATALARAREAGLHVIVVGFAAPAAELLLEQDRLADAAAAIDTVDAGLVADTLAGPFLLAARGASAACSGAAARPRPTCARPSRGSTRAAGRRRCSPARACAWPGCWPSAGSATRRSSAPARRRRSPSARGPRARSAPPCASRASPPAATRASSCSRRRRPCSPRAPCASSTAGPCTTSAARCAGPGAAPTRAFPLRGAVDAAARTEAVLLGRLAREELAATGARVLRETLTGPASLTPAERRVAELAADGLGNREIAETLWVTRKTVEVHLGKTYAKLGIRARTQLADALRAERRLPRPWTSSCTGRSPSSPAARAGSAAPSPTGSPPRAARSRCARAAPRASARRSTSCAPPGRRRGARRSTSPTTPRSPRWSTRPRPRSAASTSPSPTRAAPWAGRRWPRRPAPTGRRRSP